MDTLRKSDAFAIAQQQPARLVQVRPPHFPSLGSLRPTSTISGTMRERIKYVPVGLGQVGHTWIELFLLSLAASDDAQAAAVVRTATAKRCIGHVIRLFRKQVTRLLALICSDDLCKLFTSSRAVTN
eukprot:11122876-Karenia_brevis.AAC.1